MYKEAGPEASVQLRDLTVVECASEQLMVECFRFGVGQTPRQTWHQQCRRPHSWRQLNV
jgi:hypothetical protein